MIQWRCSICGYIHKGENPPDQCPNCKAPKEKFTELKEEPGLIHMHYGQKVSYGKEVEVNPFFGDYESLAPFIYNLPVGKKVKLHKHPTTDELFFIIKGRFKFRIGDTELVAQTGELIQGKMNLPHTFENIGDEPGVFLSVKGPKPVDREMLE
jgi:mannose-6-phosphate isomerase-like protein (cupin superfamily)